MVEFGRGLTILAIAISALAWATPCLVWQGELRLAAPAAAPAQHAVRHSLDPEKGARAADLHAHHHGMGESAEPDAEWTPACPCGCDQSATQGGASGRIAHALPPATLSPGGSPRLNTLLAVPPAFGEAAGRDFDHVPIPS